MSVPAPCAMYGNFILTNAEPRIAGGGVDLGELSDGTLFVDAYPAVLDFGGVIQVSFEDDDLAGVYEVELRGTDLTGFDTHVIKTWSIEVPPADLDWKAPRTHTLVLPTRDIFVLGDLDMALDVEVDRRWVARQTILVRDFSLS